ERLARPAPRRPAGPSAPPPFTITCTGGGAPSSPAPPRALWGGGDPTPLARPAADVDAARPAEGFVPETRPFHAHCTLGRLRPPGRGRGQRGARQAGADLVDVLDRLGAE